MWNFGTVYKQHFVNVVESFYIINLALLAGWSEYNRQSSIDYEQHQAIIVYMFTGLAIFASVIVQTFVKLQQLVEKCRARKYHAYELEALPETIITFPDQRPAPTVSYVEIRNSMDGTNNTS